jgi:hypothetical protein
MELDMHSAVINPVVRRVRAGLMMCAAVALVAACGGDGDPSLAPPPFGGTGAGGGGGGDPTAPVAADLSLALSATSLPNNGTSQITATVTAVDSNRNALADIPVTVSVNNNAVATVSGTTTDGKGVVTAEVGVGADRANRTVTVTAVSGGRHRCLRCSRRAPPAKSISAWST